MWLARDWKPVDDHIASFRQFGDDVRPKVDAQLLMWDALFSYLGGDPAYEDWSEFRPLRLRREEQWSDWLAWLIMSAKSPHIARLVRPSLNDTSRVESVRCEQVAGDRRIDIVVFWTDNSVKSATTVEIKVGDPHLEKTRVAAVQWRASAKIPGRDLLILPEWQRSDWDELDAPLRDGIDVLGWDDVSIALRRRALSGDESVAWASLARSFVGAIEGRLLGLEHWPRSAPRRVSPPACASWYRYIAKWQDTMEASMRVDEEFVSRGLVHYGDALRAIQAFRLAIDVRLLDAARAVKPLIPGFRTSVEPKVCKAELHPVGPYREVNWTGEIDGKCASIDIALWWIADRPILYVDLGGDFLTPEQRARLHATSGVEVCEHELARLAVTAPDRASDLRPLAERIAREFFAR